MTRVHDRLGRGVRDLRISVTDRCNFRCSYCMPREAFRDFEFLPRSEILDFEEIVRLARLFVGLGVRKLRLTGGEPLLRRDLPLLVGMLSRIEGVEDLSLTTNGTRLADLAEPLARAGLHRVTVSLDALDQNTFERLTDSSATVEAVMEGIAAARRAGLNPIKVNTVVRKGVNDGEVMNLVHFAREQKVILRFIEYMDVGTTNGWSLEEVVPSEHLASRISAELPLDPVVDSEGVARTWRFRDGGGEIGFVSSISKPFCSDCVRARLSADGQLFTCLFASAGYDLRSLIRSGADDAAISDRIESIWSRRSDRYSELRSAASSTGERIEMSRIGG